MAPSWSQIMRKRIKGQIHKRWSNNSNFSFITTERLQSLWRESVVEYEDMTVAVGIKFDDIGPAFTSVVNVISILVVIEFDDWQLVGDLLRRNFNDSLLPLQLDRLTSSWFSSIANSEDVAEEFVNHQYAFCPIVIQEGRDLVVHDRQLRLPFLDEKDISKGAYGSVTKVVIAPGYFAESRDNRLIKSTEGIVAARKKFHTATDGQLEQHVLDHLRRERWQTDCIMTSFASVNLGPVLGGECEFNLFFPYAPADLSSFLHADPQSHTQLRVSEDMITPRALFIELHHLADALHYLHRKELRMCHSDLKLNNILIMPSTSSDHPIGQWKITDFGIASIEPGISTQPRSWGDYMRSARTATSFGSSGILPRVDQRRPGPFQPPEVEHRELIPPGVMYRAKGDVWSLGCIAAYVLIYAIGGTNKITKMEDLMYATSRPAGRQGYFYEGKQADKVKLREDMVSWVKSLGSSWDRRVPKDSDMKPWVNDAWDQLVAPMLTVELSPRTDAHSIANEIWLFARRRMPSQNVWQIPTYETPNATSSRRKTPPTAQTNEQLSGPSSLTTTTYQTATPHMPPFSPIREESERSSVTNSQLSTRSGLRLSQSTSTPISNRDSMLNSPPGYYEFTSQVRDDCHAVQIADNGPRVLTLSNAGLKSLIRDSSGLTAWALEDNDALENGTNSGWQTLYMAGPFLLLRKEASDRGGENRLLLCNLTTVEQDHQQDWNQSLIPFLPSVSLVAVSARGHIAFRSNRSKVLTVYNSQKDLLFTWNLENVNYPAVQSNGGRSPFTNANNDRGNIEAIGFDPSGNYLVVTAWCCWYLWDLQLLRGDRKPSRYGGHSYTLPDRGDSLCSIQVLPQGKYFILHDQCQKNQCICVGTFPGGVISYLDLTRCPKPQTLAISPRGDCIAYLVDIDEGFLRSRKTYLFYCQLRNTESQGVEPPSIGPPQKFPLVKIKPKKVRRDDSVVDSVVRIVAAHNGVYAIVASITKFIEIIPLHIEQTGSERSRRRQSGQVEYR